MFNYWLNLRIKNERNHNNLKKKKKSTSSKDNQMLNIMPKMCVVNKSSLPILKSYREFFAYKSIYKGYVDTSLVNNQLIRTFLNCMDCELLFAQVKKFWSSEIM